LQFIDCDGFTFVTADHIVSDGKAPSDEELRRLVTYLVTSKSELVQTNSASQLFPTLKSLDEVAAGFIAAKVNDAWYIWNRQEVIRSIVWAGAPEEIWSTTGSCRREESAG